MRLNAFDQVGKRSCKKFPIDGGVEKFRTRAETGPASQYFSRAKLAVFRKSPRVVFFVARNQKVLLSDVEAAAQTTKDP